MYVEEGRVIRNMQDVLLYVGSSEMVWRRLRADRYKSNDLSLLLPGELACCIQIGKEKLFDTVTSIPRHHEHGVFHTFNLLRRNPF